MNIINKFKGLFYYIKTVKKIKDELSTRFNIKVDNIYRLYTVYSITEDEYNQYGGDDKINSYKGDKRLISLLETASGSGDLINGDDLLNGKVDFNLKDLDNYLIDNGLGELYGCSKKQRLDKLNYHIVVEYKFLKTKNLANVIIFLSGFIGFSIIFSTILCIFLFFI